MLGKYFGRGKFLLAMRKLFSIPNKRRSFRHINPGKDMFFRFQ
jgi:hypothetical protein